MCGSHSHLARECPRSNRGEYYLEDGNNEAGDEAHLTLMATGVDFNDRASTLMGESIRSIVLDAGCSRTVCGEDWLNCITETLIASEKASIKTFKSNSVITFVDERKMETVLCGILPCVL